MKQILIPVTRRFAKAGFPLYLVGGSVRNPLLGLAATDIDLSGPATVDEVLEMLQEGPVHATPRARHLGTLQFVWQAHASAYSAEYTCFRSDAYRSGHTPSSVVFTRDMAVDALRRDFSVNAIYQDTDTWAYADPTGGLRDLHARVLRAVTPDPHDVLKDDTLRLLRMVRFAGQLGFTVQLALWQEALRQAPRLDEITPERLTEELRKILLCDLAYPEVPQGGERLSRALGQLFALRAWGILLPSLAIERDAVAPCVEALLTPAMQLSHPADDTHHSWVLPYPGERQALVLRLAVLLCGNPPELVSGVLMGQRFPHEIARETAALLQGYHEATTQGVQPVTLLATYGAGLSRLLAALLQCFGRDGLAAGLTGKLHQLYAANAPERPSEMALSGQEARALLEGHPVQWMTPLLRFLWITVLEEPETNTPQVLRERAVQWLDGR